MLRIFATGDNHIGLRYAGHEQAAVLAGARSAAFETMVARANEEECALFVITGDLFENTYSVPKKDIKSLLDMLSCFHGTVALLPGNHDHYEEDSKLWQYMKDLLPDYDNILLLSRYRPYPLQLDGKDVVLYPALCTALHSLPGQNNLGWIKEEPMPSDGTFRIGIAHGAVEGETIDREGQYYLMKRQELENIPVDLWLIGHTHVPFPRNLTGEYTPCEKILNAGTHVQTDVSCNTEGQCFVVELGEDKSVRAKKVPSGDLRFYRKHIALTAEKMEETLREELQDLPDGSVVDLVLSGAVTAAEYEDRDRIIEDLLARFVEGTYTDSGLSRLISKELIDAEFAETSLSASFLTALLEEPKQAQLAYELLRSLKEGRA